MLIVGERINATNKRIAQAIQEKDADFICNEAMAQVEAGADYVDVNAAPFREKEIEYLEWLFTVLQEVISKPLSIDTPDQKAAAAALKWHKGKAMINSITGEKAVLSAFLPLLKEYKCDVVALCQDDNGIPTTLPDKLKVANQIIESLVGGGIELNNIYIDPLVQPISTDFKSALVTLDAIEEIMSRYPGVHTICGISNVSFGLPSRKQINRTFTVLALQKGLDAAIIDPCDRELMANITTTNMLLGKDEYCSNYLRAYRSGKV